MSSFSFSRLLALVVFVCGLASLQGCAGIASGLAVKTTGGTDRQALAATVAGGIVETANQRHHQVAGATQTTYINTGIRITKVDCLASGGVWGKDDNGANVCVGQSQPQKHQHRTAINQNVTMCLYKLGWSNGGGGTTQGLRNDQFSPQQKAGDENLGRWAPGMAIPAGHAAKTC